MREAVFESSFEGWRKAAREVLRDGIAPNDLMWVEAGQQQGTFSLEAGNEVPIRATAPETRAPKKFIEICQSVSLHGSPKKWALMYRALWRISRGERVMENPADGDLLTLTHLAKEVQKDAYRMRAFLRFRESKLNGESWFVAWYEPEHDSVALNEEFFKKRFARMRWSILTPLRCMHWNGDTISYSPGATKSAAPTEDQLEPLWIAYYSNIFNPARIKPAAMQAQLLKRNWRNLPEAVVIEPLLRQARQRSAEMIERSEFLRERETDFGVAPVPRDADLERLSDAVTSCRACPLWKSATCAVFGEGPAAARIVFVGEQPGDQEDKAGRPFVGPAGQLLDRALLAAGLDRKSIYVTNAVKHFKYEPRGKRRIHKTASAREVAACRPWLEAELLAVRPQLIVALGATATRAIFGQPLRITEERGRILDSQFGPALITVHPSSLLRLPEGVDPEVEFQRFVADLTLAKAR